MLSGGMTYGMSCSADCPQPPAAAAAPVVATILKNDRRSIPLIHSSALLGGRRRSPADMLLRTRRAVDEDRGMKRVSGLQPCEPYHVENRGVNNSLAKNGAL